MNDTESVWWSIGEATRLELLEMTTIPKKYHEGYSEQDELNPQNLKLIEKLVVKKNAKAIKRKYNAS